VSFKYTRHAFIGTASSSVTYYGAILGDNMPPRFSLCLPGRVQWPERFAARDSDVDDDYMHRERRGPPFVFYDEDWNGSTGLEPDGLHGLAFSGPDLPGQGQDDVPCSAEGDEPDSTEGLGWQGEWGTTLLQRKDQRKPLGERTEIVWRWDQAWGVELRLQV
ncbi:hypothetical protein FB45DRAFT_691184, partial [Roridomyces roridus]